MVSGGESSADEDSDDDDDRVTAEEKHDEVTKILFIQFQVQVSSAIKQPSLNGGDC